MKRYFYTPFPIICFIILVCFPCGENSIAGDIRDPVWTGSFYPANQSELEQTIDSLAVRAEQTRINLPSGKQLKALILPHAGYIYSGLTAAHAYRVLLQKQFEKIILIGPDHRVGFKDNAISDVAAYKTPLGLVRLHKDAQKLLNSSVAFKSNRASDESEHSLEVILPFLQRFLTGFEIIPIVMGKSDIDQTLTAIDPFVDSDTLIVASSDLSHYLQYSDAVKKDRETIKIILNLDYEKLFKRYNAACGKAPILFVIKMARQYGWQPALLHYSNSGDTQGDKNRVVGYTAIAFYGGEQMKQISQDHGQTLVRLARQIISKKLGQDTDETSSLEPALKDDVFQARCGTFVTLHIDGQLRGCIGSLTSSESIIEGVKSNAINAAFKDFRFTPLTVDELKKVDIEVSVLTEPKPLEVKDSNDLLSKLRPNIDGVIIRKGGASATFLPQVWEQLPGPKEFLSHLCQKAGLRANAWKDPDLNVMTYQVQYFEEE